MFMSSLKAVATFVGAVVIAVYFSVKDRTDVDTLTFGDWLVIILAALATTILTWFTPNYNYTTRTLQR